MEIFAGAPRDPIKRIAWMEQRRAEVNAEIDADVQRCYFNARLQGRLESALRLGLHARKRVMAMTRHENERTGRQIRWQDN